MANVEPFLRRTNSGQSRDEYLFLPADLLNWDFKNDAITPNLPGKTASDISGDSGTNFGINLGSYQQVIRVTGTLVDVASDDVPQTLPDTGASPDIYVSSDSSSPSDVSGKDLRQDLAQFAADLSNNTYSEFKLGWPRWASTPDNSLTFSSITYQLFEGTIRNIQTEERAGEEDQYQFSLDWVVADVS